MDQDKEQKPGAIIKLATFIVDKRNLFFLIFSIAIIFSAFSSRWVNVENALSAYLSDDTETRKGMDLMEKEFTTFGTANVMVSGISYEQAQDIEQQIEAVAGVDTIEFDDTTDHYNQSAALYTIMFGYDEKDDRCLQTLDQVKDILEGKDYYVSTELGDTLSEIIAEEMNVIIVIVAIIVLIVLVLTSQTYAEIPVLIITFLVAIILNMGTNFLFGTISFVSNSVTSVLQLALSLDYAIIFCNRYKEEHRTKPAREATIVALSKAIPEISSSSLTTVAGLTAMCFMQFKIGPDMGVVLIKAILFSLLAVFTLMPGLLMLFSNLMDKTVHKNFVPDIPFVGKFAYKTRKWIPPIFLLIIVVAFYFSNQCPFVYGYSTLSTPILNDSQIADQMIEDTFGPSNFVALVVPAGNYDKEVKLINALEARNEVEQVIGLCNTEAMDGYTLTEKLKPRQFSELAGVDIEVARLLYSAYAINDKDYAKIINNLDSYSVPLMDMFLFAYEQVEEGYVDLDEETMADLTDAYEQMQNGKKQLQSDHYSRMLVYLNLPEEGTETFDFIDEMHTIAGKYYNENHVYVVGESTSQYDLQKSFARDNTVVNVVSVLFVLIILLFTFQSAGMPVLLIAVIQGSIWMNFAFPTLQENNLFFMSYLIVSSIQMGANIDYAIVISSRYMELSETMSPREAIIETMNFAFPTIITSGTILAIAGILIGQMTSDAAIVGIGQCLGRGTIISIILVMFVLPQILLLGEKIIRKTSFTVNVPIKSQSGSGLVRIDGRIRGQISGNINGTVHATVRGDVNAIVETGEITMLEGEEKHEE